MFCVYGLVAMKRWARLNDTKALMTILFHFSTIFSSTQKTSSSLQCEQVYFSKVHFLKCTLLTLTLSELCKFIPHSPIWCHRYPFPGPPSCLQMWAFDAASQTLASKHLEAGQAGGSSHQWNHYYRLQRTYKTLFTTFHIVFIVFTKVISTGQVAAYKSHR